MKHIAQLFRMTVLILLFNSCNNEPTFRVIAFNDAETKATEITENSARLSCQLDELEQGKYYAEGKITMVITNYPEYFKGQTHSGTSYVNKEIDLTWYSGYPEVKSYSTDISSLTPSTTYYFAPFVGNNFNSSKVRGEMKSFTTKGTPSISVTTGSATNITTSSVSVSATYKLINEAKMGEFGIVLSTSSYPTYYSYTKRQTSSVSPFTCGFSGLADNTTYYYRAYAKDSKGTLYYGDTKSFTTSQIPSISVTTGSATNITTSSAMVSATYELKNGVKMEEFGILLHTSSAPNYYNFTKSKTSTVSPFTCGFTGLAANRMYYYRAYAKDSNGTLYYGDYKIFTTLSQATVYSLNDYLGTYTMTYHMRGKSGYQTQNNVIISAPTTISSVIRIDNLPPCSFSTFGDWDAATHKITLSGDNLVDGFKPIYYDMSAGNVHYTLLSDGYCYIDFIMTSPGIIEMKSPSRADQYGYFSNAYHYPNYSSGSDYVVYDVTLTKTSSN